MKKTIIIISVVLVGLLIVGFGFEKETKPKGDTRLILEHTYSTYITPTCYGESEVTNFLEDSDLEMAKQLGYKPHNECSEEALKPIKEKIIISLLHDMGLLKTEWSTW